MIIHTHKRIDLALNQFETAVALFLANRDLFSVITLAGAADVIFCQMISRSGRTNFTDMLVLEEGNSRSRAEVGREVNDLFHINDLKHLDPGEDGFIEINPRDCACGAILKASVNYQHIEGHNPQVIKDFLIWVQANLDPEKYNVYCDPNWKPKKE